MAHYHHIPTAEHTLRAEPAERLTRPFIRFARLSCSSGIVLMFVTALAMLWANSKHAPLYDEVFHTTLIEIVIEADPNGHSHTRSVEFETQAIESGLGGEDTPALAADESESAPGHGHARKEGQYFFLGHGLTHWINDLFMAVFFLVVGLEIKREMLVGELASPKRAALPIFGALGGMIVPAGIFALINLGNPGALAGWGVPMATDIAFAMGVLATLGRRVPTSLKVFLLSLAIVDDLGALLVIAIFYTENPQLQYLTFAGVILGALMAMNMARVRWLMPYLLLGLPLWYFIYLSGVHATIAGVLLALTIPAHSRVDPVSFAYSTRRALEVFENADDTPEGDPGEGELAGDIRQNATRQAAVYAMMKNAKFVLPPLLRLETTLHPWTAFLIIPLFALANAGIPLQGGAMEAFSGTLSLGVIAGLAIGKPLGIVLACLFAVKIGVATLPRGITWRHVAGAGMLGGVGFTMAIFIANLAFAGDSTNLEHTKLAILAASVISTVAGVLTLLSCKVVTEPEPESLGPEADEYYAPGS
jgi:NhaA family Na+:H+ antiporter